MEHAAEAAKPLHARLVTAPVVHDQERARRERSDLLERCKGPAGAPGLAALMDEPAVDRLLAGVYGASPYLTTLASRDDQRLERVLLADPDRHLTRLVADLVYEVAAAADMATAMRLLRDFKSEIALLAAIADLGGVWPVMRVTAALTEAADAAVIASVRFLFRQLQRRGDWLAPADDTMPDQSSGYMVIGMGKYGAHELNYSSDIDLIVFFDPARARLRDGLDPLAVYVRMTRDLVRLLQERTGQGYVFRVDLRLRPDPGATHVAMSTSAALHYYESFGQNWERAALIKARAVGGDIAAGQAFLRELSPFIWRKYLDFAAIADIHAMKRQIHAFKGFGEIGVAGHNIKLGRGGIREIEFFVQTQQLIAGGRQPDLRTPRTLDALERLVLRGWLERRVADELAESYRFFRAIEHRLQMVLDEQTQTLPEDSEKLTSLARFSGYPSEAEFAAELTRHLARVQGHYGALFEGVPELTAGTSNMVFAGEADDPQTVEALRRMRYSDPAQVIATVRGWHHGRYPAVRTPRARELLTEVQPLLIEALADTADPNLAFLSFDKFLAHLPSGVQLFSLLRANPRLLRLIAAIMGSAPRLARILSRRSRVLDAVLDPGFFGALPEPEKLGQRIDADLATAHDLQEVLDRARVVGSEQAFLIGVRLISGTIGADQAGRAYAVLAEHLISALQDRVAGELRRQHGQVKGGAAAVVAMGKLGGREMTAASDLDLILIYDFDRETTQSDGSRPLSTSQYFTRLTQRLISAMTAPTAEGQLYEVDMRLRPSGLKGPVATQLSSFIEYQMSEAWTWEHMALTRGRVITGPPHLRRSIEETIATILRRPRDRAKVAKDVIEMRALVAKEKGTEDRWDLKQVRGGLVDLEFIAQFLQLVHAARHPEILDQGTVGALEAAGRLGLIGPADAETLIPAARLTNALTQVLRLCLDGPFDSKSAPNGLKLLLCHAAGLPDFTRLEAELADIQAEVARLFEAIVAP